MEASMLNILYADYHNECIRTGAEVTLVDFLRFGRWNFAMTDMLFRYLACARAYRWGAPTLVGLVLFAQQVGDGVRKGEVLC